MMKKYLVALVLATSSHVALAAPQTFDEAFQSLSEKLKMRDESWLKDVDEVLLLAQTSEQKARVRLQIGNANFNQGKPATARFQYERMLILPNLSSALKNTALVMIATTYQFQHPPNYIKTRATFQRIVDDKEFSARDRTSARLQIASTYNSAGDSATARAQFQNIAQDKTIEIWARASALQLLAEMDVRQENYAAARDNDQKFLNLDPDDTTVKMMALDGTAQSYFEEKNFLQARSEFAKILKLDIKKADEPNRAALEYWQAQAQLRIAQSYASEGDKKRARVELAKVSELTAGKSLDYQVKEELQKLDKKPEKKQVFVP